MLYFYQGGKNNQFAIMGNRLVKIANIKDHEFWNHEMRGSPVECVFVRVSVQGVKSLGGHFACLCRGFDFYEVFFFFLLLFFKKKREIL